MGRGGGRGGGGEEEGGRGREGKGVLYPPLMVSDKILLRMLGREDHGTHPFRGQRSGGGVILVFLFFSVWREYLGQCLKTFLSSQSGRCPGLVTL